MRMHEASGWRAAAMALMLWEAGLVPGAAQTAESGPAVAPNGLAALEKTAREAGLTNLQISSRVASPGRVVVEGFSARLGEGTLQGRGLVDLSRPGQQHRMRVRASGVDAPALIRFLGINFDGTVRGRIDADLDLVWSGLSGTQVKRTLSGPVRVRSGEGSVSGAQALAQAVRATGVDALKTFSFTSAQGAGVLRRGQLDVESLTVSGSEEEVRGRGAVDLGRGLIAMRLDIYLEPSVAASSTRPGVRAVAAAQGETPPDGRKTSPAPGGLKTYPAARQLVRIPVVAAVTGPMQNPQFTFREQ